MAEAAGLPPGIYSLNVVVPGMLENTRSYAPSTASDRSITIRLEKGLSLLIHVTDPAGARLTDAQLELFHLRQVGPNQAWLQPLDRFKRNQDGDGEMTGLLPGVYCAAVRVGGGKTVYHLIILLPGKNAEVTFQAEPAQIVEVHVVDAAGKPVAAAAVGAYRLTNPKQYAESGQERSGTTDKAGNYEMSLKNLGAYLLRVVLPGGQKGTYTINVDRHTTTVTIRPGDLH